MATSWSQVGSRSASATDRLCAVETAPVETAPLQFRCSDDPFPAVLNGFRRSLSLLENARKTGLYAAKSLCFVLRGTQESNLTLRFWRSPRCMAASIQRAWEASGATVAPRESRLDA
jgi:hypothetical protein